MNDTPPPAAATDPLAKNRIRMSEWRRLGMDLNVAAKQFRISATNFGLNLRSGLDRLAEVSKPIIADLKLSFSKIQAAAIAASEARANAVEVQSRFLRAGYIPSIPLMEWRDAPSEIRVEHAASAYERGLRKAGFADIADLMGEVPALSSRSPVHALRVIFPDIERMVREEVYEAGAVDRIANLRSLRIAANMLLYNIPAGKLPDMLRDSDYFITTSLGALDYSYASDDRFRTHMCVFKKVPMRNLVVHGAAFAYDDVHVVNAMTLLFIMSRFTAILRDKGIRIPVDHKQFPVSIEEWKTQRREGNNVLRRLFKRQVAAERTSESPTNDSSL
ncbi:hypothetical protein [Mesorhizobium sp. Root102]|uniref:hypothetical protein n=1 Tax=Mesorhizobium sp. Root102 TaxID=1736422 RepID=UPI000AD26C1E|nr:hypothetical protein [Mesorhizobium sp. Root102]